MNLKTACFITAVSGLFLFSSCEENPTEPQKNEVTFSFETSSNTHSRESLPEAASIILSLEDDNGSPVVTDKKIPLNSISDNYASSPLLLEIGDYSVTKFLVLDESDNIVYGTPKEGSLLASFVDNPLPVYFEISADKVSNITLDVIETSYSDIEDLGYTSLSFGVNPTVNILISVFEPNASEDGYQFTGANLSLFTGGDSIYSRSLGDSINIVKIPTGNGAVELRISKESDIHIFQLNADTLNYFRTHPLSVIFDVNRGLVAKYTFDGNANDASGNSLNGTVLGATLTSDRHGNPNKAYSFDGVDDRIEVANSSLFENQEVSVSAWFKAQDSTGAIITMSSFSPIRNNCGYYVGVLEGNLRGSNHKGSNQWVQTITDDEIVSLDEWHHVVYTFNGNNLKLYLNDSLVSSSLISHTINYSQHNPLQIGAYARTFGGGTMFKGDLDDIRIYNRALNSSEVHELFTE